MKRSASLILVVFIVGQAYCDLYLHNPRGSNNRLNENTATRANANRVFDSQNNNRGGYNVGDVGQNPSGNNEGNQYRMKYFQSGPFKTLQGEQGRSILTLEWTNQHGCGGNENSDPQKQNCHMIIQYMCQDDADTPVGDRDTLRNGVTTQTPDHNRAQSLTETEAQRNQRKNNNVKTNRALQESWDWYDKCYMRERNKGLFTADQKLKNNNGLGYSSAIYTRENPNGNQYGYECPEERDQFPYWHPTPWTDIAVLTDNTSLCQHFQQESFNVKPKGECVELYGNGNRKYWSRWNNEAECTANGGQWIMFSSYMEKAPAYTNEGSCVRQTRGGYRHVWAVPYDTANINQKECLVVADAPDCRQADYSRSNHLGNGINGENLRYDWILPYFPSMNTKRCVLRMRYNISTDDYAPFAINSSQNQNLIAGIRSPVEQNPYVDVGGRSALRMNINTNQYGRIFQDRSHVFKMRPRPSGMQNQRLMNLNVRGKRGNIVQVYPAVEYDFVPNDLRMTEADLVHIQWTGSNTHNNGGGGGDGQAGDEGQGKDGSDRNNMVQIRTKNDNFPVPFEQSNMWNNSQIVWIYHGKNNINSRNLAVSMATSGYYRCVKKSECPENEHNNYIVETKGKVNSLLNNAPASFEGAVLRFTRGTYHYTCTRNNNFTNRSQKGTITVS
ncbi:hypothetical protein FSP39_008504 [Pinctada imbricata]|uniref:Protein DD3-3 n=1 Tax=Pinctada imbricata TaxID=66713 RepID=A0AA88YLN4_PINIB|nr:hypothetical protein FSP39_008504 [Pinctada imbricata]